MSALYVHGLPGSVRELELMPSHPTITRPDAIAPFAGTFGRWLDGRGSNGPVRIAAFSLGAHAALRAVAEHPGRVRELALISPAAPLQLGDFLPNMAGAPVFRAALRGERRLRALTTGQAIGARLVPSLLLRAMFSDAAATERHLLSTDTRDVLIAGLRHSLLVEREAYVAAIMDYVADWRPLLDEVRVPVRVIAGTADTWTPPAMTGALADALRVPVEWCDGLGHYGTLHAALPELLGAD